MVVLSFPFSHIESLLRRLIISLFKFFHLSAPHRVNLVLGDNSLSYKFLCIKMINTFSFTDHLIHHRLSKSRLILLVMTVSTIPDDIDENVLMELLAVFKGNMYGFVHELGLVGIYVNDRSLNRPSNVSTIKPSSSLSRCSRETDLIVSDYMDDAI